MATVYAADRSHGTRLVIINADDYGASAGVNLGIQMAHRRGVVTSASLMVDMPAAESAVEWARRAGTLDLGLHVQLTREDGAPSVDFGDTPAVRRDLRRQIARFVRLVRSMPTHVDAHHNVQRNARLRPVFEVLAREIGVPVREHSAVTYVSSFYGQWEDGSTHPEHVSSENLLRLLREHATGPFTELGCHPGYVGDDFVSSYHAERELELVTLCEPGLRDEIERLGFRLGSFREYSRARAIGRTA